MARPGCGARSWTSPPATYYTHTQEQANACEPTDQHGRYGDVEIGDGDRSGDRESNNPAHERTTAILRQEPL